MSAGGLSRTSVDACVKAGAAWSKPTPPTDAISAMYAPTPSAGVAIEAPVPAVTEPNGSKPPPVAARSTPRTDDVAAGSEPPPDAELEESLVELASESLALENLMM